MKISKFQKILFLIIFINSCALSPGMSPNIQQNIPFENIDLSFHELSSIDFNSLPNQSQKYQNEQSKLEDLVKTNQYRYILGPGDIITLNVTEIAELNADYTIDGEGNINIPYAEKIQITGSTRNEAEILISEVLSEFYKDPQVSVAIKEFKSSIAYITGEVTKPASILLTEKKISLIDAIIDAGYIKDQKTFDKKALLRRRGEIYNIDLYALLNEMNTDLNIFLQEDDVIHVQKKNEDQIYVFGEATQGTYSLFENSNLTKLLSNAKINQLTANANKIYVIREDLRTPFKADIYLLNAKNPNALLLANKFPLLPQDIIYIAPSEIVRWNRVISLITPQSGLFSTYTDANKTLKFDTSAEGI